MAGVSLDVRGQRGAQESWNTKGREEEQEGVGQNGGQGFEAGPEFSATSRSVPGHPIPLDIVSCCPQAVETEASEIYFLLLSKW